VGEPHNAAECIVPHNSAIFQELEKQPKKDQVYRQASDIHIDSVDGDICEEERHLEKICKVFALSATTGSDIFK